MIFPADILQACTELVAEAQASGAKITMAESCTGGLLASAVTSIDGASAVFSYGFITYANEAKTALLGVDPRTIERYGAVSAETARAMAEGALKASGDDVAVAITGVAGPGGGTPAKPVGLVHFGVAAKGLPTAGAARRYGNLGRDQVRLESVRTAVWLMRQALAARGGGPSMQIGG